MKENDIRDLEMVKDFFVKDKEWLHSYVGDDSIIKKEFTAEVCCPCCSSDQSRLLLVKNYFRFVECTKCSTVFVNPRFTQEMIDRYYKTREERLNYRGILTCGNNQTNRVNNIFKPRKKMIEDYFKKSGRILSNARLLDVGCASGQFLSVFTGKNIPELYGVEASSDLAAEAKKTVKKATIIDRPFEQVVFEDNYFDIVTLWEVLEHVFDPYMFLLKIVRALKSNGILVMSVPNIEGFDIQILWDKGNAFSAPSHLNYFRRSSINILLERAGLIVEEIRTPGLLDVDIVRNRMNNDPEIVERLGLFWADLFSRRDQQAEVVLGDLQSFIKRSNLSSHMVAISKKPF